MEVDFQLIYLNIACTYFLWGAQSRPIEDGSWTSSNHDKNTIIDVLLSGTH